jgi:hypothetical protein
MNTVLKQQHAESFLALSHRGQEIGNRVCQILTDLDAVKSADKVKVEYHTESRYKPLDQVMVRSAINAVQFAEKATMELMEVATRRKMQMTQEYKILVFTTRELGTRLYRNLWEVSLNVNDKKLLRDMIKRIADISVWEDLPATLEGLSYARVKNDMSGTIAFEHAYGVTFMEYKQGLAKAGWTVLRDTLEESLLHARYEMDYAISLLTPEL